MKYSATNFGRHHTQSLLLKLYFKSRLVNYKQQLLCSETNIQQRKAKKEIVVTHKSSGANTLKSSVANFQFICSLITEIPNFSWCGALSLSEKLRAMR